MSAAMHVLDVGARGREAIAASLREMADELERGEVSEAPGAFVAIVVSVDGSIGQVRWSGRETLAIGGLEYAKHRVIARWDEGT